MTVIIFDKKTSEKIHVYENVFAVHEYEELNTINIFSKEDLIQTFDIRKVKSVIYQE